MRIRPGLPHRWHGLRAAAFAAQLFALACSCAHAQAPLTLADLGSGANASAPHDLYLAVSLNGQSTSLIAHFRQKDGHLIATGKDLSDLGFEIEHIGIAPSAEISLDAIPGLRYRYDEAKQAIDLQVPDSLRTPYRFDTRQLHATPQATSSSGLLINYDAFAQTDSNERLALESEERYFNPEGVFSNTGIAYLYRDLNSYIRYDTSWSHSDPTALTTTQFGDTISSSLAWTRSLRIAGFQWRSNFTLRPDLVTFPVPSLSGTAVVPSSVDLYINSVRQYSGNVPSGPFVVNNVPGITGAGQATVITHDALGRTVETSVPLYVDPRLLAQGLSSYSFEAGFLRRNYGIDSFDYDPRPALSATARYGLNDYVTLEGHAEATSGLYNAGGGALARLGMAGVVNGSLSASSGRLAGTQASAGYEFIQPRFSVDAQTIRAFGNYGDLAARDGTPVPNATDTVTIALPLLTHQTFSVSYIGYRYPQAPASAIGSVSYTVGFGNLASASFSAYQDFKQHDSRGVFLSVSFGLGSNTSINTTVGKQNGQTNYNLNALRPPDYGGGWGWGVQAGDAGSVPFQQGQVQYLGNDGEVTAIAQNYAGHTSGSLDVTGAVVLMDHAIEPSRRIDDGFALVSTDGIAGIPVLHENRVIGSTDSSGNLLIPDLNSYQHNEISIDSMKLPADARIDTTSGDFVPQAQSGVIAHFGVTRYSAASIILHGPDGKVLPPGARVKHRENGKETIVGYDGLTFIDELQPDNHLQIESGALHCSVQFAYTRPTDGSLPTLGPFTCSAGDAP